MKESLRITTVYIIVASLWIFFSDSALVLLTSDVHTLVLLSQLKGFFYILVTGTLLFFLIRREINQKNEVIGRLETTVRQKEEVMKELHHRIKNNLQNVISIIHLETGGQGLTDRAKERILHKIYALSAVHDLVYNFESFHQISLRSVLENFFSYIAFPVTEGNLRINDAVQYSLEDIIPILMTFNELFDELSSRAREYSIVIVAEDRYRIDLLFTGPGIENLVINIPSISLYLTDSRASLSLIHQDGSARFRISFIGQP